MSIINIKNLFYSYGKKEILKNINLDIDKNVLTGIIGSNGSGKSTLIKNIVKYIEGNYDRFEIDGKSLSKLSHKKLSQIIAYIPQKSNIIPNIKVREFILLGRFPLLNNPWNSYSKKDYEAVYEKINILGIEDLAEREVENLSGGELQKVLLAKALAQESKILLLDEPTSALDLNNAVEFMKILKNISLTNSVTPVIIIHDLNLASLFCDVLIVLKDGKVYKKGSPKEIITKEYIKEIFNLDCHILQNTDGKNFIVPLT